VEQVGLVEAQMVLLGQAVIVQAAQSNKWAVLVGLTPQ
jgi:hypothetical protein